MTHALPPDAHNVDEHAVEDAVDGYFYVTYFPVTSVRNRESILRNGLDPARMGAAPGIAGSRTPRANGIFVRPPATPTSSSSAVQPRPTAAGYRAGSTSRPTTSRRSSTTSATAASGSGP